MSDFNALHYRRNGSRVNLGIDAISIEEQGRTVVGYATLDNVDFANDIVLPDASLKAFEKFRGNIRVQHDRNRPVGTLVGFEPATVYDEETGKSYNAIKVAVRVSEGAEDVWKMCLDGTLSGFSIGAAVKKASLVYNEELKKNVQLIEEYALLELSLVDNPMNELANIVSVYKAVDNDGVVEKGFVANNLFWCAVDRLATKLNQDSAPCPKCGEDMANLGHIEEDVDIKTKLHTVFESQKGGHPQVADIVNKDAEGDQTVTAEVTGAEAVEETVETVVEDAPVAEEPEEVVAEDAAPAEEVEAVTEVDAEDVVDPVETDETELDDLSASTIEEKLDAFLSQVREEFLQEFATSVKSYGAELDERIQKIESAVESMSKAIDGVTEAQTEISEKLKTVEDATNKLQTVEERLDKVADSTAVQKSVNAFDEVVPEKQVDGKVSFKGLFTENILGLDG